MDGLREAASWEGLVVLAVIYFVLNLLQKAGKKAEQTRRGAPSPPEPVEDTATQEEALSLEHILRGMDRVKQQKEEPPRPEPTRKPPPPLRAPPKPVLARPLPSRRPAPPRRQEVVQDERGPMGRQSRVRLPSAEEVEDRTSLEGGSLEQPESLENFDDIHRRRPVIARDDEAEAVVQRRIQAAEARNREHREVDHQAFHARIRQGDPTPGSPQRYSTARLREAVIWREIIGPPKAFE